MNLKISLNFTKFLKFKMKYVGITITITDYYYYNNYYCCVSWLSMMPTRKAPDERAGQFGNTS